MVVIARSTGQVKELSMMLPGMGAVPAKSSKKADTFAERSGQGPMSQQGAVGSRGYEMYPQGFLRLVGCHDSGAEKHETARRLH
jgi:hypothetical protein